MSTTTHPAVDVDRLTTHATLTTDRASLALPAAEARRFLAAHPEAVTMTFPVNYDDDGEYLDVDPDARVYSDRDGNTIVDTAFDHDPSPLYYTSFNRLTDSLRAVASADDESFNINIAELIHAADTAERSHYADAGQVTVEEILTHGASALNAATYNQITHLQDYVNEVIQTRFPDEWAAQQAEN